MVLEFLMQAFTLAMEGDDADFCEYVIEIAQVMQTFQQEWNPALI